MRMHLVLVGLSGAGKSTVGPLLARRLDTHFTDIDLVIERATGLTVAELFAEEGEARFRARERQAVRDAFLLPPHVIAPGGGWAAQPGSLDDAAERALVVYLAVPPAVAAARLGDDAGRPLLAGDPTGRLQALLGEREPWYRRSGPAVDAGLEPEAVADRLLELARREAGW